MKQFCDMTYNIYFPPQENLREKLQEYVDLLNEKISESKEVIVPDSLDKRDYLDLSVDYSYRHSCVVIEVFVAHRVEYHSEAHRIRGLVTESNFTDWMMDFLPYFNDSMEFEVAEISHVDTEEELVSLYED